MKIAINAWSIPASVPFPEAFAQVSAAGFDGIELNLDKEDASAHGLETGDRIIRHPGRPGECLEQFFSLTDRYDQLH